MLAVLAAALFLLVLMCRDFSFAYSVLTHEEIVDLLWTDEIQPLLLTRFPALTQDQLKEAHAYAYGGAVIQDPGYYPFGNKEFRRHSTAKMTLNTYTQALSPQKRAAQSKVVGMIRAKPSCTAVSSFWGDSGNSLIKFGVPNHSRLNSWRTASQLRDILLRLSA